MEEKRKYDILVSLLLDLSAEVRDLLLGSEEEGVKAQIRAILSQIEDELGK